MKKRWVERGRKRRMRCRCVLLSGKALSPGSIQDVVGFVSNLGGRALPDEIDWMLKVSFLADLGVSKYRSRCSSIIVTLRITTPWLPSFLHHSQECLDKCLHNDALASAATGVDGTYNYGVSHGSVHNSSDSSRSSLPEV